MSASPRRGRPTRLEAQAIEERIRDAAVDAFVTNGFDRTTMEAVATAAAVTKRTLYAKHADKEALFAAVIPQALADMPFRRIDPALPDGPLDQVLRQAAHEIISRLTAPDAVKLRRFATLEASRLARLDHTDTSDLWSHSLGSIVGFLTERADRDEIAIDDAVTAADLFVSMVAGGPTIRADMGVIDPPDALDRHVDGAVDLFLAGILPRRDELA